MFEPMANCPKHPKVKPVCPACFGAAGGKVGGRARSKAKQKSSRANGRLGGRPTLEPHSPIGHKIAGDPHFKKSLDYCPGCVVRRIAAEKRAQP